MRWNTYTNLLFVCVVYLVYCSRLRIFLSLFSIQCQSLNCRHWLSLFQSFSDNGSVAASLFSLLYSQLSQRAKSLIFRIFRRQPNITHTHTHTLKCIVPNTDILQNPIQCAQTKTGEPAVRFSSSSRTGIPQRRLSGHTRELPQPISFFGGTAVGEVVRRARSFIVPIPPVA